MRQMKKHYYILLDGYFIGETWAVSPAKARTNFWWKWVKRGSVYTDRKYSPSDFDVVEA